MNESNSEQPKKGLSCSAQLLIILAVIAAVIMSFVSYINSSYVKGLIRAHIMGMLTDFDKFQ